MKAWFMFALIIFPTNVLCQDISKELICKAAIATINGRDFKSVKVYKVNDDLIRLSYVRPSDGSKFNYQCKIEGDRVMWAMIFPEGPGRWRDNPLDGKIYFKYINNGKTIRITEKYSDGSETVKEFPVKK
jgi:hypothetical protein